MKWVPYSHPLSGDLEEWEEQRVRQVVDIFLRRHSGIPGYDEDDLYQEGHIAWLRARKTYRAERGASIRTYIARVVENRLTDLAREARAASRRPAAGVDSLDAALGPDGGSRADYLPDDAASPSDEAERAELAERIARVRGRLPARQKDVFDALAEDHQKVRIARDLGISRDTLYDEIRRIQDACRDAGLEEFLR